jgi:L-alanine-DL-glutamate epimerase-like enolase superfamily enzyme
MCSRALAEGMCWLKLHEVREDCVRAAREVAPDTKLILDVNCAWTPQEAVEMARALQHYELHWLEEPIHPPEDIESLSLLKFAGIPIALGEHAYSPDEFQRIIDAGSVDYLQPGILKMGGIKEVQKVLTLAAASRVAAIPYTPYHGPGLLASLHLMATLPEPIPVEFLYYTSIEGLLYGDALTPKNGYLSVPQTPGLGYDPDPEVLSRFAV